MRIVAQKSLIDYWTAVPATKSELEAWHAEAKAADWSTPAEVKAKYGRVDFVVFLVGADCRTVQMGVG